MMQRATDTPTRLSVEDARQRIVALCAQRRVAVDRVPLDRALGRVLAVDVAAPHAIPPFANSAMDGYALRGEDLPREGEKRFRLLGAMLAGAAGSLRVDADACVRITTGAPLPHGADTVVVKERVRDKGAAIVVTAGEISGANVRPAGEDLAAGAVAAGAGEILNAARLGLVASCGLADVPVARRPRVALLVTGDELVPPGEPLGFGQIHDSNRYSLAGLLESFGIVPQPALHVRDDVRVLRDALRDAASVCDVVVTSGGASAGEADHMPRLVAELGRVHFWKVRMKPGMPFLCGEIGKALVFALPGNPVSSYTTFLALVGPGLMAMQGAMDTALRWRARLAMPVSRQGSGMMSGVAEADGFVFVPEHARDLAAGDVVAFLPLPGLC